MREWFLRVLGPGTRFVSEIPIWVAVGLSLGIPSAIAAAFGFFTDAYQNNAFRIAVALSVLAPIGAGAFILAVRTVVNYQRDRLLEIAQGLRQYQNFIGPALKPEDATVSEGRLACRAACQALAMSLRIAVFKHLPESDIKVDLIWFAADGTARAWALAGHDNPGAAELRLASNLTKANSTAGQAVTTRDIVVVPNAEKPPEGAIYQRISMPLEHRGLMAAPVEVITPGPEYQWIGALCIAWKVRVPSVGKMDKLVMTAFAHEAGAICSLTRALYAPRDTAMLDFLTA